MTRKNFIPVNEGFTCESCGQAVLPARGTFRNHCPKCLASRHVDFSIPGDRLSPCGGLMPAIAAEGTDPGRLDLIHRCENCGRLSRNRSAPDDDFNLLLPLTAKQA